MEKFNEIQLIKRRFFALRNGVVADALRNAGLGYRYIFGLNLPQISEIAAATGESEEIALKLRDDVKCRESQLLAPMLYPVGRLTPEIAAEWIENSTTAEAIDVVCLKLLRKMPQAWEVIDSALESDRDLTRYAALRLIFNLLSENLEAARKSAEKELSKECQMTSVIARQILEEISFLEDN